MNPNQYSTEEENRRCRLLSKIGWEQIKEASRLIKQGKFKGWSNERLGQRYKQIFDQICPKETNAILASNHVRIDDAFIAFEREYGAEALAIEKLLYRQTA